MISTSERRSGASSQLPRLIQAGMGVRVSNWQLARAVSSGGERLGLKTMGVVSGTGIGGVFARQLQGGDPGGYFREALDAFPYPELADRIWRTWYVEGGIPQGKPYKSSPMVNHVMRDDVAELIICGNFAEVWLAKQGHRGPIGINFLEKIQTPRLPEILGAMIAGSGDSPTGSGRAGSVCRIRACLLLPGCCRCRA